MSEQQHGIKETKEAVVGLLTIASLLATHFKKGVKLENAMALFAQLQTDEELKAKIEAAMKDVDKVGSETKELSAKEILEILIEALPEVEKLIEAVKK